MMRFDVLTLFPNIFSGFLSESLIKKAIDKDLLQVNLINFRDYSTNKHKTVDDTAYSGGAGMLISVEPIHLALKDIEHFEQAHKVLLSPSGKVLTQEKAKELSQKDHIVLICGHYEGIDDRIHNYIDEEISIGDFVLMGGEIPAMAIIEATIRLVGAINPDSIVEESFSNNLLEYPQYTKPLTYDGHQVPEVLVNGNHKLIEEWKRYESLKKTYLVRPDLLKKASLSLKDYQMLWEIKNENQ